MTFTFKDTIRASYGGYLTQAIVNNLAPLLFLTFEQSFGLSLEQIALLIMINFGVQITVDAVCVRFIDRIGYRRSIVIAHVFSAIGLAGLGLLPHWFPTPYAGLVVAVMVYAVGGGIIEVLISPIVEACPTANKESAMSLLHSFYCWGHVGVVLLSTAFFVSFGLANWPYLTALWALFPAFNALFFLFVPIRELVDPERRMPLSELGKSRIFWVFIAMMLCAGAAELCVSQWASAFAEQGLGVSKTVGDLLGPCFFAAAMGISRVRHSRRRADRPLGTAMVSSGLLAIASYLVIVLAPWPFVSLLGCGLCGVSVGIFWPGTFSSAAKALPAGGTAMFAFLALAGDLGCFLGPGAVGLISGAADDNLKLGIFAGIVFPIAFTAIVFLNIRMRKTMSSGA